MSRQVNRRQFVAATTAAGVGMALAEHRVRLDRHGLPAYRPCLAANRCVPAVMLPGPL